MGRRVDNLPLSESGDVFPPCDHNRCQMVPRHVTGCENDWLLFSHSPVSSPWSQFFFFNSSRRVFVALVFSFDKFFSCSILPKRLSLFVLFRSCISCLLSCSRCMSALHGIGIAYRSTTMQLSPHPPGSVTCFSSSRLGSSSPHCISSSEFGYLGAITLRGCQCHPLRSLKAIRSLFSNGKEIFLRMGLLRFETPSLSFQDPRTTSEDSCISTVQVWHSFTRGGAILRSNSSSLPHYMVCIW